MSKTVTIRLDDKKYDLFQTFAKLDNRALSNFIETATSRYIEDIELANEFEMAEINADTELQQSLNQGLADIQNNKRRQIG